MKRHALFIVFSLLCGLSFISIAEPLISNDITHLTPITINTIAHPTSTTEVIALVKKHTVPISIAGGKYSMGGQTATDNALQIDIKKLNHILAFDPKKKEIIVETGANWRQIQELIDPYNLSVQIMQSYADFTVGGSLSVNVHGRYVGEGPIILSVKQIKMVLADGSLITSSPTENPAIFYGAIGGYGAMGVITEATFNLTNNTLLKRTSLQMPITQYHDYFQKYVNNNTHAVFHNTLIYPPDYKTVRAVTYVTTNESPTISDRLQPKDQDYSKLHKQIALLSSSNLAKRFRKLYDRWLYSKKQIVWRNYEASYNVAELAPIATKEGSFVLQEYFIPTNQFDNFYPQLITILRKHNVNVLNISIRHAKKDSGSLLAWAKTDVFAFVIYYKQGVTSKDQQAVNKWTTELIDTVIEHQGSYYLPYQIIASQAQFEKAYPQAKQFFELKKQLDPSNKFRNKLLERYVQY